MQEEIEASARSQSGQVRDQDSEGEKMSLADGEAGFPGEKVNEEIPPSLDPKIHA